MTPTPEQLACITAARDLPDNLCINALAGAAKTTTLEMIGAALTSAPILYLVFNKRNAEEAKKRLPGHIKVQTFNGCGHSIWMAALGKKRIVLSADKTYKLLKNYIDTIKDADAKQSAFDTFGDTLKLIRTAKIMGYLPEHKYPGVKRLCSLEDLLDAVEFDPSPEQITALNAVLTDSIAMAYEGTIDFDDQIYMPTLFGGSFPRFPLVMADEAQDLSPLNHAMLRKLVTKRLIIVGDPWQSIYGFRGAVANGMSELVRQFNMKELPLSTSFRCPRAVIRRAQERVPHMAWPEWAAEGEVNTLAEWRAADIPDGAAIICRNNAPLFKCGLQLIKARRGVKIIGADIGPALVKILKKLGEPSMRTREVLQAIEIWHDREARKTKKLAALADRAECLRIFAEEGETLSEAIAYAEHLFQAGGPIQLLSGHKSKGLEWDTVYHLDPWRIPSEFAHGEAREQEFNVKYVIETRAKRVLNLVDLDQLIIG